MSYQAGALVRTRGRDWIVQPGSDEEFLLLKPLGGRDDEITGVLRGFEEVEAATFSLPSAAHIGDARQAGLLRDAALLSFRANAGPFRSFGRIAVEPRPYQLVPLLMALRQETVRLLIADDVGIGKTVEALLIARELLDRGEIEGFSILCPPHLAEQWESELREKFHLTGVKVLASTAARLDRGLAHGESIFAHYPITIVSTDYIKSDRRRDEFLRSAPDFIIVDEAHTAADPGDGRGGRHQRHELLRGLAEKEQRHILLVTATPHSGNEAAFRSLLSLLNPKFLHLPDDLTGRENEPVRRELAQYFVQRKRGDIKRYLGTETDFPTRNEQDVPFSTHPEAKKLLESVLAFALEELQQNDGTHRQRIRWWATLGLLRALASSPAAAAATLRNRAVLADAITVAEADAIGRRTVFDHMEDDAPEGVDITPGSIVDGEHAVETSTRRLQRFAKQAEALKGKKDAKLDALVHILDGLLKEGRQPIVFCRFIDTADYVADELKKRLKKVEIAAVTGTLAPGEREHRVELLADHPRRVLVATDCLSEGINLQNYFDSVVHYDLSWNPTRHEQREGRVDRYGQSQPEVVVRTMYGVDNQIDGVVLDVLLRKHRAIRTSLGVSVPVPADSDQLIEAIFEGMVLRGTGAQPAHQEALFTDFDEYIKPRAQQFNDRWDAVAERETRSRTMFAQERIKVDDVMRELEEMQRAIGDYHVVERFVTEAARAHHGTVGRTRSGAARIDLTDTPQVVQEAVPQTAVTARFAEPIHAGETHLTRTHPFVEGLASYVLDSALDNTEHSVAKRAGVMRTNAVTTRTTLILARFRYHITTTKSGKSWQTLAEETVPLAFIGAIENNEWLPTADAERLLHATPSGNVLPIQAEQFISYAVADIQTAEGHLAHVAEQRAAALLDAHRRVRTASNVTGLRYKVDALMPVDVIGTYVYIPSGGKP